MGLIVQWLCSHASENIRDIEFDKECRLNSLNVYLIFCISLVHNICIKDVYYIILRVCVYFGAHTHNSSSKMNILDATKHILKIAKRSEMEMNNMRHILHKWKMLRKPWGTEKQMLNYVIYRTECFP